MRNISEIWTNCECTTDHSTQVIHVTNPLDKYEVERVNTG